MASRQYLFSPGFESKSIFFHDFFKLFFQNSVILLRLNLSSLNFIQLRNSGIEFFRIHQGVSSFFRSWKIILLFKADAMRIRFLVSRMGISTFFLFNIFMSLSHNKINLNAFLKKICQNVIHEDNQLICKFFLVVLLHNLFIFRSIQSIS